jgi:S1-C subfamily serine protease
MIQRKWLLIGIALVILFVAVGMAAVLLPSPLSPLAATFGVESRGNAPADASGLSSSGDVDFADQVLCQPSETPYVGITYLTITDALAKHYGLETANGVLITAVASGSPAAQAGLQPGDVILAIDQQVTDPSTSIVDILRQHRVGDRITLDISRRQDHQGVSLLLSKRPGN